MGAVLYTVACLLCPGRNLPCHRLDDIDLERVVDTVQGFPEGFVNVGISGLSLFFRLVFGFFVPIPNVGFV